MNMQSSQNLHMLFINTIILYCVQLRYAGNIIKLHTEYAQLELGIANNKDFAYMKIKLTKVKHILKSS